MESINNDNRDEKQSAAMDQINEERMLELRKKFLQGCLKYTGVPYKKKYHAPGSNSNSISNFLKFFGPSISLRRQKIIVLLKKR